MTPASIDPGSSNPATTPAVIETVANRTLLETVAPEEKPVSCAVPEPIGARGACAAGGLAAGAVTSFGGAGVGSAAAKFCVGTTGTGTGVGPGVGPGGIGMTGGIGITGGIGTTGGVGLIGGVGTMGATTGWPTVTAAVPLTRRPARRGQSRFRRSPARCIARWN